MPKAKLAALAAILLWPATLPGDTGTSFAFNSPVDGSAVTVTPNQSLPVLVTIRNTSSGLAAAFPLYYTTQVSVTPTCPPAANPCGNYLAATPGVPPFLVPAGQAFVGAVTTLNFHTAPPGFYTIKVSVGLQSCSNQPTCPSPDTSFNSMQFTVQVVSVIGAPANVLAHFAVGGSFTTDLYVVNSGSQTANFTISFYSDSGAPVSLPFTGLGTISILSDSVPAFGANFYEAGDPKAPLQGGWGLIKADPSITVQALFRNRAANGDYYEAAVPSYPGSNEFRIPFDATTFAPTGDQLYTGFAIVNLDSKNSALINCTARDFRGLTIQGAISVPLLNPLGHWANYLFPALTGVRGTIDCTSANAITGLGLRFIGTNAFSSLPVITQ